MMMAARRHFQSFSGEEALPAARIAGETEHAGGNACPTPIGREVALLLRSSVRLWMRRLKTRLLRSSATDGTSSGLAAPRLTELDSNHSLYTSLRRPENG